MPPNSAPPTICMARAVCASVSFQWPCRITRKVKVYQNRSEACWRRSPVLICDTSPKRAKIENRSEARFSLQAQHFDQISWHALHYVAGAVLPSNTPQNKRVCVANHDGTRASSLPRHLAGAARRHGTSQQQRFAHGSTKSQPQPSPRARQLCARTQRCIWRTPADPQAHFYSWNPFATHSGILIVLCLSISKSDFGRSAHQVSAVPILRLRLVSRLDAPTSGVLPLALGDAAAEFLQAWEGPFGRGSSLEAQYRRLEDEEANRSSAGLLQRFLSLPGLACLFAGLTRPASVWRCQCQTTVQLLIRLSEWRGRTVITFMFGWGSPNVRTLSTLWAEARRVFQEPVLSVGWGPL